MTQLPAREGCFGLPSRSARAETKARAKQLLTRVSQDIGLATVARELEIPRNDFEPELIEAIKRGDRYLFLLMPKSRPHAASNVSRAPLLSKVCEILDQSFLAF
jgi:hypothetical protein